MFQEIVGVLPEVTTQTRITRVTVLETADQDKQIMLLESEQQGRQGGFLDRESFNN